MKSRIVSLLFVILTLSSGTPARSSDPVTSVKGFYKFFRSRSGAFNASELKLYKRWFTAELYGAFNEELRREKEFLKKEPTGKPYFGDGFGFVPVDECHRLGTFYPDRMQVRLESSKRGRAIVAVKFYLHKACGGAFIDTWKIELIRSGNQWLLNDWIYSDGSRLVNDIKTHKY